MYRSRRLWARRRRHPAHRQRRQPALAGPLGSGSAGRHRSSPTTSRPASPACSPTPPRDGPVTGIATFDAVPTAAVGRRARRPRPRGAADAPPPPRPRAWPGEPPWPPPSRPASPTDVYPDERHPAARHRVVRRHGRRRRRGRRAHRAGASPSAVVDSGFDATPPRPRRPRRPQREAAQSAEYANVAARLARTRSSCRSSRAPTRTPTSARATAPTSPASSPPTAPPARAPRRRARRRARLLRDRRGPVHHRGRHRLRPHARPARPVGHRRGQQLVGQPLRRSTTRATRSRSPPRRSPTTASSSCSPPATAATATARRPSTRSRSRRGCCRSRPATVDHQRGGFSSNGLRVRQLDAAAVGAGGHTHLRRRPRRPRPPRRHRARRRHLLDLRHRRSPPSARARPARTPRPRARRWPPRTSPAPPPCCARPTRRSRPARSGWRSRSPPRPSSPLARTSCRRPSGCRSGRSATATSTWPPPPTWPSATTRSSHLPATQACRRHTRSCAATGFRVDPRRLPHLRRPAGHPRAPTAGASPVPVMPSSDAPQGHADLPVGGDSSAPTSGSRSTTATVKDADRADRRDAPSRSASGTVERAHRRAAPSRPCRATWTVELVGARAVSDPDTLDSDAVLNDTVTLQVAQLVRR